MIKTKISAVQISLSWIFMILIGTFFFVFAYNFIGHYKEVETAKSDLLLKQTIRTILNQAGRTAGIEQSSLIPLRDQQTKKSIFANKIVQIECPSQIPIFSINGNLDSKNEFLKNYPTFMTIIDEKDISNTYLAIESFKMPFKITNTLAFVSTKNLILFDENSKITDKLLYKFRKSYSNLNFKIKKFSDLDIDKLKNQIKDNSYSSIVFISDSNIFLPFNLNDFKIYSSLIQIKEKGLNGNYGKLKFSDNSKNPSQIYEYIDLDGSLNIITQAIFSKKETFDCSYKLLVKSIKPIYSFYINKAKSFEKSNLQLCSTLNSISNQKLNYRFLKESLQNIDLEIQKNTKIYNASNLYVLLQNLDKNQLNLENFNCDYVY